ncbi:MAG: hypothetical protein IKQ55_05120 [Kiritimatiellae bacterium]|jgi:hypothetical protein|nr:hypothetical protein [Kiritimatiellia bacterium]MBR4252218.1 hypothetical protein [Kiritimatiellia bacterium]
MSPSAKLSCLCFLLAVSMLGLDGYMYERWKRAQTYRPLDLISAFGLVFVQPFRYLKLGLEEKDRKAPLVFGAHWLLFAAVIWLALLAKARS